MQAVFTRPCAGSWSREVSGVPAVRDDRREERAQVREIWKVEQAGLGVAEEWGRDWKRRASG